MGTRRLLLTAVFLVAAYLRFTGIDHGLRRSGPDGDEFANHVGPFLHMRSERTLDPQAIRGYPGFFNDAALPAMTLGFRWDGENGAALAGRALVALFSLLNIALAYRVTRTLAGAWPGLFVAALLAVSRGDVRAAHSITADVVVVTGALGVLWLLVREAGPRFGWAGFVAGVTIATKLTGLLALPAILAAWLRVSPRARPAAWALASLVGGFAVAAPFAVLRPLAGGQGAGFAGALRDYYSPTGYAAAARRVHASGPRRYDEGIAYTLQNVGIVGSALAVLGGVAAVRARSMPVVAVAGASLVAMLPAQIVYPRHALVPTAAAAILAGVGLASVARRAHGLAVGLALAALAQPAHLSWTLARRFPQASAIDLAADWVEANAPGGLVAAGVPRLLLDPERFEVRSWVPLATLPTRALAQYDVVVGGADELRQRSVTLAREFVDADATRIGVATQASKRRMLAPPERARTSEGDSSAPLWPGKGSWTPAAGAWLEGEWLQPQRIDGFALEAASSTPLRGLEFAVRESGAGWRKVATWPLRPGRLVRRRAGSDRAQVLALAETIEVVAIRLTATGAAGWTISSFDVYVSEPR